MKYRQQGAKKRANKTRKKPYMVQTTPILDMYGNLVGHRTLTTDRIGHYSVVYTPEE